MRIFQLIRGTAHSAVPGNQTWHRNLYEPLIDLGHDVVLFSTEDGRRAMHTRDARARAAFSQKLLDTFRAEHARKPFDLVFAYLMDGMVETGVLDEIRKAGVPTCNFSCNNIHQFYLVDEISLHIDYNLHAEKDAREKFLAIGATPLWWPMASNPTYFKPLDLPPDTAVSFVGTNYGTRARYALHLLENGVDVHLYGPGWRWGTSSRSRALAKRVKYLTLAALAFSPPSGYRASANLADHDLRRNLAAKFPGNVHDAVSDDELIALYSRSRVSLGFLEVYPDHDASQPIRQHVHLRDFEAPMCGALYCTGYMQELEEMFEPDKEVLMYRNADELLDKTEYYLDHPAQAEQVRNAGRARALQDHTYQRRFEQLFQAIGLSS